jgi:hypothetical protein
MHDGLKPLAAGRIGEDYRRESRAVNHPILSYYLRPEFAHDLLVSWLPWLNHLVGDDIGIHYLAS